MRLKILKSFIIFGLLAAFTACDDGDDCSGEISSDNFSLYICGDPCNCNIIQSECDLTVNCTNSMTLTFAIPASGETSEVEFSSDFGCTATAAKSDEGITLSGECVDYIAEGNCELRGEIK